MTRRPRDAYLTPDEVADGRALALVRRFLEAAP